jgi:thioredoxin-related protein
MKKFNIFFTSVILVTVILSYAFYFNVNSDEKKSSAQEIKWGNFENGINEPKSAKKKMVVDVYTDWCGWCKKMDKATYSNSDVISYINKNFVAVRLNAESKTQMNYLGEKYTEQQLAQGFGITGYPSTIFFDEKLSDWEFVVFFAFL